MNQELKNKLFERFPKEWFPADISIGDGWFQILYDLLAQWELFVKNFGEPKFKILQIKQKFGGLRIYTNHGAEEIIRLTTNMAEKKSSITCEVCGSPGIFREDGWLSVKCEQHK